MSFRTVSYHPGTVTLLDQTQLPSLTRYVELANVERQMVGDALRTHEGNVSAAARALGVARQQLQRLMKKYALRGNPSPV